MSLGGSIYGAEEKLTWYVLSLKDMWKKSTIKLSLVHKYVHGHIT